MLEGEASDTANPGLALCLHQTVAEQHRPQPGQVREGHRLLWSTRIPKAHAGTLLWFPSALKCPLRTQVLVGGTPTPQEMPGPTSAVLPGKEHPQSTHRAPQCPGALKSWHTQPSPWLCAPQPSTTPLLSWSRGSAARTGSCLGPRFCLAASHVTHGTCQVVTTHPCF